MRWIALVFVLGVVAVVLYGRLRSPANAPVAAAPPGVEEISEQSQAQLDAVLERSGAGEATP